MAPLPKRKSLLFHLPGLLLMETGLHHQRQQWKGSGQAWPTNTYVLSQGVYLIPVPFTLPVPRISPLLHCTELLQTLKAHLAQSTCSDTGTEETESLEGAGLRSLHLGQMLTQDYSAHIPLEDRQQLSSARGGSAAGLE